MRPRIRTAGQLGAFTVTACLAVCLAPAGAGARGSCASRPVRPRLVHHIAPPRNFLSSLAVLRRPQTAADLEGFNVNGSFPSLVTGVVDVPGGLYPVQLATASVIDADYVRKLGSVDGYSKYLIPARVRVTAPMSRRCLRRLSDKDRRYQLKLEKADRARGVVLLFDGSIVTYGELIGEPSVSVFGGPPPVIPGLPPLSATPEVAYGIVPDGVFSVTLLSENNPPLTAQIATNFFSIEVPSSFHHGSLATVIWLDASGHTLKTGFGRLL
jgi:hypothetical protein